MNPTKQLHDLGQSLWLDNIMAVGMTAAEPSRRGRGGS
jgi:hypothetical protein